MKNMFNKWQKTLEIFAIIGLFMLTISLNITNVKAYQVYTQSCFYKMSEVDYVQINFEVSGNATPNIYLIDYFKVTGINSINDREYYFRNDFSVNENVYNYNKDYTLKYTLLGTLEYRFSNAPENNKNSVDYCVEGLFAIKNNNKYEFVVCGVNTFGENTCNDTEKYIKEKWAGKTYQRGEYYTGTISGIDSTKQERTDVVDKGLESAKKIESICNMDLSTYNYVACQKELFKYDALEGMAKDQGRYNEFSQFIPKINLKPIDCDNLFYTDGVLNSFGQMTQMLLNIIRYLAPLLVIVFSTMDFIKAVASQDKELVQKAMKTAGKRLIIATVLFFIPAIVTFILQLYNAEIFNNPLCGLK